MTRTGHVDARNYGDSSLTRVYVPIASAVFESCLRLSTQAAKKSGLHHQFAAQFEAPLRVDRGSPGYPKPSAYPRPSPHAVPRVDGASRFRLSALLPGQFLGIAGKEFLKHVAEGCFGIELRQDGQTSQPHSMDEQIAGWQIQLHRHSA